MLEKKLGQEFNTIFKEYQIWIPSNRTAGWPDRGIQISNSRLIWFELKCIPYRSGANTIRISELTAEQAAWLAKWQRAHGFCFLFLGFIDNNDELIRYGVLKCSHWAVWLNVPKQPIRIEQLVKFTDDRWEILEWFQHLFIPQARTK